MQDLTGKQIGRYILEELIGEGGMGVVYRAVDTHLNCDVAIKILASEKKKGDVFLKRFQREAQSMARLTHPNLVKVTDYGEQDGIMYLVMPYVAGGTLSDISKPIPTEHAAALLVPVARALGYAHSQGMIHRDVKLSNVLLTASGEPMVTDFGIVGLLDHTEAEQITQTGVGLGTPAYMAPEQVKKDYDHRVDIYALGVMLYELVVGRQPFRGDTPMDTLIKHATQPLPPPREINAAVSPAVEAVIVKALAKQPDQRFQTMEEFAQALQRVGQDSSDEFVLTDEVLAGGPDVNATVDEFATPVSFDALRSDENEKQRDEPHQRNVWALGIGIALVIVFAVWGGRILGRDVPHTLSAKTGTINEVSMFPGTTMPLEEESSNQYSVLSTITVVPTPTSTPEPSLGAMMLSGLDGMEMVYIPSGVFPMGSEEVFDEQPVHDVYLDGYWIDRYEVTNIQYSACVMSGECELPDNLKFYNNSNYEDHPVVYVSWHNAKNYCEWVGRRLPSEAEWEKAARGMDERIYPWGDQGPNSSLLNYDNNFGGTSAVGSFPEGVSQYGTFDMAGNVWEWVLDKYGADYYEESPNKNPSGPISESHRVVRGGSWDEDMDFVRSANRSWNNPVLRIDDIGFRCAVSTVQ